MSIRTECSRSPLPLSKLKGIQTYYPNDLYEFARLTLKLMDARDFKERPNTKSRLTVYGLAKRFAQLIDPSDPPTARVLAAVKKHGLPLDRAIELDEKLDFDRQECLTGMSNGGSSIRCPWGMATKRLRPTRKKASTSLRDRDELISKLHSEGMGYRQIADRFAISRERVKNICETIEIRKKWPEFRKLLSIRAQNILLTYLGNDEEIFQHPERVAEFDFETLMSLKNLGRKTAMDIEHALSAFGYSLRRGKNSFPGQVEKKKEVDAS